MATSNGHAYNGKVVSHNNPTIFPNNMEFTRHSKRKMGGFAIQRYPPTRESIITMIVIFAPVFFTLKIGSIEARATTKFLNIYYIVITQHAKYSNSPLTPETSKGTSTGNVPIKETSIRDTTNKTSSNRDAPGG